LPFGLKGHAITQQKIKSEPTYISGLKVKNRPFGSKRHGRSSDLFIFVEKILPFSYSKKSRETWSREFFCKISQKNRHISMKKIMKWPRFLEDLGR
jgi:hypothetical protein